MNPMLQVNKGIVRKFLQTAYDDPHLIMLLDHARSGQLAFVSCCCFIGILTANHRDHKLRGDMPIRQMGAHLDKAREIPGAHIAEHAYNHFARYGGDDERRRAILIPMILAEIKRRQYVEKARLVESPASALLQEVSTARG